MGSAGGFFMVAVVEMVIGSRPKKNVNKLVLIYQWLWALHWAFKELTEMVK